MLLRKAGFTLIELISVILILGVVSAGIFGFIGRGAEIYVDTTEREQLLSDSRFIVERLNRELRRALPNSVRENVAGGVQCLEFVPIRWSSFYLDVPVSPEAASNTINTIPLGVTGDQYSFESGDQLVIFPSQGNLIYNIPTVNPGDTEFTGHRRTIASLGTITVDGVLPINLQGNVTIPSGNTLFSRDSPASRAYIVSSPVSYCANSNTDRITRHQGYAWAGTQPMTPNAGSLMAENFANDFATVQGRAFRITEAALARNAVIHIRLNFARNDELISFNNEVHIPNAP